MSSQQAREKQAIQAIIEVFLIQIDGNPPPKLELLAADSGFMSDIYRATFPATVKNVPESVIIKIPHVEKSVEAFNAAAAEDHPVDSDIVQEIHNTECTVYQVLSKSDSIPLPKCYLCRRLTAQQEGVLVLEDMQPKGAMVPLFANDGISFDRCQDIVRKLAKFHAFCLESPQLVANNFNHVIEEKLEIFSQLIPIGQEALTSHDPVKLPTERFAKIQQYCTAHSMIQGMNAFRTLNMAPVLVHGDPWTDNIFFAKESSGNLSNNVIAVIDWQLSHIGSPMEDLSRLLSTSASPYTRTTKWTHLIQTYFTELSVHLSKEMLESKGYTLHNLTELYKMHLGVTVAMAIIDLGTIMGTPKYADDKWKDAKDVIVDRMKSLLDEAINSHL